MNKKQLYTFGIGLFVLSLFMFSMAIGWGFCGFDTNTDVICQARKYTYSIPAIISMFLAVMFSICGALEK